MTSRKIDQILLTIGVVLIFISSYQLFFSRLLQGENLELSLGTLENTQAVVKIKNALALDWRDAYTGSSFTEQQLIYTDDDSSAELKFSHGHMVSISENSLVKISSIGKGLNVERGLIRAKIEGSEPLVIEMNGEEVTLKGDNADIQISLQGNVGEIGVLSGEISIEKEGQVETINKNSAVKVEGDTLKKQEISVTLLEPVASSIFYTLEDSQVVSFKWDPTDNAEVLIADNPGFKRAKAFRGEGNLITHLAPGTYYWKAENSKGISLISNFSVVKEVAPQILRPKTGEVIKIARSPSSNPEIFVQWKGHVGETFAVEWEDGQTHSQVVTTTGFMIPVSQSGDLRFRVKIQDEKRTLAAWSEWQDIRAQIIELPQVPTNLMPEELELQTYTKEPQNIELSWTSSNPVELEILTPKNDKITKLPEGQQFVYEAKDAGEYRWRIRSKDELERLSDWSEFKTFKLEDLSHEVTEGFQRIQLKKPDQEVTFNWKSENGSNTVFELSEQKDFSHVIVKKEVRADEVKVVVPKTGNFYWRSRQYHPDGTFQVSEPKKVIIEPAPAPTKPEKLPDLEVPLEWQETTYKRMWWSFIIAEAHADDFKGVAKVQLPANEDAKKYIIKIYADEDGEDLLLEQTLETPVLLWEKAQPGKYYWQYAVIDFWGRQSPFSDISTLTVTGSEPLLPEKPKLYGPIRATEVENKNLKMSWSESDKNKSYRLEISADEDFKKVLIKQNTSDSNITIKEPNLKPGLYYWRITATNESKKEVLSNTGRFSILPPLEKIVISDQKGGWVKQFGDRLSFAWAPSMDTYEFSSGDKQGEIDGTTMNSVETRYLHFGDSWILGADLLRQNGKVFEGENYLFQRFMASGTWKKKIKNHLWGPGLSVGFVSGYSYSIDGQDNVSPESVSGLVYGPHLQGFYTLNSLWEFQGKLAYLLGAIPQIEFMSEANRKFEKFYLVLGVGMSNRTYSDNEGKQSSLRFNLGLGKEF